MASKSVPTISLVLFIVLLASSLQLPVFSLRPTIIGGDPAPAPWPDQFHSLLLINNSKGESQHTDLWYDFPNGRNFNIIRRDLDGEVTYDLEWDNGTSFVWTDKGCKVLHFPVGILRPDWLDGAKYLGERTVDGIRCNMWEKVDFIWYYEDVDTKKPVYWEFFSGMVAHVSTFEVGAVLEDAKWQAPAYCFGSAVEKGNDSSPENKETDVSLAGKLMRDPTSNFAAGLGL